MKIYKTGEISKLANVTERTIRYYDQIGLLKPSFVLENGYRQYTEQDLMKLQQILSLKNLGFSLEDIYPLVLKDNLQDFSESIDLQLNLVTKKIESLTVLKDTLINTKRLLDHNEINKEKILDLLQLSNYENELLDQYRTSKNLDIRIQLHEKYSVNPQGWFNWLFSQIDFSYSNRILEVGCGNGVLWDKKKLNLRNREIFLSDASKGMIEDAKSRLSDDFSFMVFECEAIPFKKNYFDLIIANHVLFYLKDVQKGLSEIKRVLKDKGVFYCTTYGKNHMKEITELVQEFNERIVLSRNSLYDQFGLENGENILENEFSFVEKKMYEDHLEVTDTQPLIEYIMSCHGNQNELLKNKLNEFKSFLDDKIHKKGFIYITKEAGLFICKK